ncbi:LysR family transcriptional regulator [Cupriavidus sp. USMAA2-4]|uniref:LysR family transcriptional regulator n=1 Tax=Cupriavidus malaysiensis TaxID=367825 RepID=A0A1D9HYD0_9BURK|nr:MULTISPECIES: LysR family transcriptional regulator [Cupriavidus]AOY92009.1 LysR family transcriptional regulator [Cupriavidus sp. USMAA2-4]AOY98432.1 LysR family transcriptional regulator [Cupriavidus sp. USMAHM13]AOZ04862.1 LysR family transcriptional regulator [Cupriavidus malaysiensis]
MNNLRAIDLNLLVVLEALLAERHISRAALRLHLSQPAVSHALGRLRQLLDDPLLVRGQGGLVLTARAHELSGPLAEALAQVRILLGPSGFQPATARRTFRLAMSDYGAMVVLPRLLRAVRKAAPGIDLVVTQASREAMTAKVADGEIDAALGVFANPPESVRAQTLFEDDYACAVDAATVRDNGRLDQVAYLARSHVLVATHSERVDAIDAAVAKLGGRRKIACVLPHWSVAPALIAGTNLVLTTARRSLAALQEDPRFAVFDPPFALPGLTFSMIWHERIEADPGHMWLRERVVAAAAGQESGESISLRG